ncbi:type I restriction-modification system endonuclease [Acetobacter conturbans]|uniref:Type I restriction-modification system endonuclease n=1 Tax=Acetobacter conturbans TaxID=1737472 RepID=A0ABX0K3F8_9PROT|nr:type I restriction-modification system endonuclease [Acetobacter conturbans]NHN90254.1 type I restriction-modification system endonuclease [Acetobacter conturbans]
MTENAGNFAFLVKKAPELAKLGQLAEHFFLLDPPTALIKIRQFAELTAKDIAARYGELPDTHATFDEVLRVLQRCSLLQRQIADLFFHIKRVGNTAVHENTGTRSEALEALKMARLIGVWFHQVYNHAPSFRAGPFVPPRPPEDATPALREEIENLRKIVTESTDAEARARLAAQEAIAIQETLKDRASREAGERAFWEQYAAEADRERQTAERALAQVQAQAMATPAAALSDLAQEADQKAQELEIDEATTRVLIDAQLRAAGWTVDSKTLRHSKGTRPEPGQAIAIAEWPTESGPVDYALFIDEQAVGVIEAKRKIKNVSERLGQSRRYGRDIILAPEQRLTFTPSPDATAYRVPFMFVTNGRPYFKRLETLSGIWFWDARTGESQRALVDWFSPRDLTARLEQKLDPAALKDADRQLGVTGLRDYQIKAIHAIETAIAQGQRRLLVAMATGTGKTRLAIALMYELLRAERFRRILFLVDRRALGIQTLDSMSNTETASLLKFDKIFPIAGMDKAIPDLEDRVQVSTVQAMIRRVFDNPDGQHPTPGNYDLIIVDEAHRGYVLDAELREEDLGFRNLNDYLSAYRRVLDYFDATQIALTATPALHTREIFGAPVFHYSYRQAVIDGHLIDHRPPRRITTALSQTGIHFDAGEEVAIADSRTNQVDLFDLEDEVDFEVAEFNKKVHTEAFNRAVTTAVALECPPDKPGKTLIFAARDTHADLLVKALRETLAEEYGPQPHDLVEKITGDVDRPNERIKVFRSDPRPKYVVTVDLLTTGIDIPSIVNLVFVRRVSSRILYDQMIGRATRKCDEIGKEYFRIFDAVDIYANLQNVTDMKPVVVNPSLSFATLLGDLKRAETDEDRTWVRDQIVVRMRQRVRHVDPELAASLEAVLGPLTDLPDQLRDAPPAATADLFARHPSLATVLDSTGSRSRPTGIYISEHEDELVSITDTFGQQASPADYIESFEAYVRANMNTLPALIAATQKPRDLTRQDLKDLATALDEHGFSEASLRRAYGTARNADIAAHILGFVRQAALGDPLVPYATRVENGIRKILASRNWTPKQTRWLNRIGRALKDQPVGDPALLSDPLFSQQGGFDVINQTFDSGLGDVLKDLNAAIWLNGPEEGQAA